ncbi:MAG: hypothetical protein FWH40_04515 [Coriobacteriia bacterium]|nr:hypothetical protein [Coriobacteriia bacterium]
MLGLYRKLLMVVTTLALVFSLYGCANTINEINVQSSIDRDLVIGASAFGYMGCYCDKGLVYFKDRRMWYLDCSENKPYIICSRANCQHNDENCFAWISYVNSAYGLALFDESFYVIKRDDKKNSFDLLQMELGSGVIRTVSTLDIGENKPGNWTLIGLAGRVYYVGDFAWIEATYQYCEEYHDGHYYPQEDTTVIGINLNNGEATMLYALSLDDGLEHSIELAAKDFLVIKETADKEPLLSEELFYEALENGAYSSFSDEQDPWNDPYNNYMMWHMQNKTVLFSYLIYDIKTGNTSVLDSGELGKYHDADNNAYWRDSYRFFGVYNERMIYSINEYETANRMNNWKIYSYDLESGSNEFIIEVDGGNVYEMMDSGFILKNSEILYCLYTDNKTTVFYSYSLSTGETIGLFEDDERITFRIHGETKDCFIGSLMKNEDMSILYILSKNDFYAGNLGAVIKLKK